MKILPRTRAAEAKTSGYTPTKVNFKRMSAKQAAAWVHIEKPKYGHICGHGPGAVRGTHIVCYYDETQGACTCCYTMPN
jgi:hypothetical protein